MQVNVAHVNEAGVFTGTFTTFDFCGWVASAQWLLRDLSPACACWTLFFVAPEVSYSALPLILREILRSYIRQKGESDGAFNRWVA